MEATREKRKKSRTDRKERTEDNGVEGEIPNVPTMEEFGFGQNSTVNETSQCSRQSSTTECETAETEDSSDSALMICDTDNKPPENHEGASQETQLKTASFEVLNCSPNFTSDTSVVHENRSAVTEKVISHVYPINLLEDMQFDNIDPCEEAIAAVCAPRDEVACDIRSNSCTAQEDSFEEISHMDFKSLKISSVLDEESVLSFKVPKDVSNYELTSSIQHLYANSYLEQSPMLINEFLSTCKTSYPDFQLYELLNCYLRASVRLDEARDSLSSLIDKAADCESKLWSVSFETMTLSSTCMDDNPVSATHKFMVASFDKKKHGELSKLLKDTKELANDTLSLLTYSVELNKIQINNFLNKSFKTLDCSGLQGLTINFDLLRLTISTLFLFIRKANLNINFLNNCLSWVTDCISLLLGGHPGLDDFFFVVNHVMRCPAGMISKKLVHCIQVPPIDIPLPKSTTDYLRAVENSHLDYSLALLSLILNPVSRRENFLGHSERETSENLRKQAESHQWVLIDSDGEDEPSDVSTFKEADLVAALQQVPFEDIFRRILLVPNDSEQACIAQFITEESLLKLLSFATRLVTILGQGFVSYYTDRYRQLVKLLGRLILHTTLYVTEVLEAYIQSTTENSLQRFCNLEFILSEYDLFFRSSVGILYGGRNIGTLQFFAALPFQRISTPMLWHVYCAITKWTPCDKDRLEISSDFENDILSMNESDVYYLLNAITNMAVSRDVQYESSFLKVVTLHLFQVGFLSPLTREFCSKNVRDLLNTISRKYPELISLLLHTIDAKLMELKKLSVYVLKELDFDRWVPSKTDLVLISKWLNQHSNSLEAHVGRLVIQSMNWGFGVNGALFLDFSVHYHVSLMIYESSIKWEQRAGFIKDMNPLANKQSIRWSWEMLQKLDLYASNASFLYSENRIMSEKKVNLVQLEMNPDLENVKRGVENRNAMACYIALLLTDVGSSVPLLCSKGFDYLEIILQNGKYEAAVTCLFHLVPLFVNSSSTLTSSDKFKSILSGLLQADMTYIRMAKNLIRSDYSGEITKSIGDVIKAHFLFSSRYGTDGLKLLDLWTNILFKLDSWNKDMSVLYLLDVISQLTFLDEEYMKHFSSCVTEIYKNSPAPSSTGIASLFNWSTPVSTLITSPISSLSPYFLFHLFSIEMELEDESKFWDTLCLNLHGSKSSVDAAVKKAGTTTKYPTTSNFLSIYRWIQLGLDLPCDHQLILPVWKNFFYRFFHRVSADPTHHVSVTPKFFEGPNKSYFEQIQKKLNEVAEYFKSALVSSKRHFEESDNLSENPVVVLNLLTEKYNIANAMSLWVQDMTLLQSTLYVPALPLPYLPEVLLSLMEGEKVCWSVYIDVDAIRKEISESARGYLTLVGKKSWFEVTISRKTGMPSTDSVDDVIRRLNSYDKPLLLPTINSDTNIVAVADPPDTAFASFQNLKEVLTPHITTLKDFSKQFSMKISQIVALNAAFWEDLPNLYRNDKSELVVNAMCSGKAGSRQWESCAGAASILFKYTEAKLNENLGFKIHQNRTDFQRILDESGSSPPPVEVCLSAVFLENMITKLILMHRESAGNSPGMERLSGIGCELFYYSGAIIDESTEFYPPTRQLFSSLMEVLGREFIASIPGQCSRLVSAAIRSPQLIGSFAPHVDLASCTPHMLVDIYQKLTQIPKQMTDLTFVLLSKFDITSWLKLTKPTREELSHLLHLIWNAIVEDGQQPLPERLLVYDLYRSHLRSILLYDISPHYGELLELLLKGTDGRSISVHVWYDFCNALSYNNVKFFTNMDPSFRKREIKRFAAVESILTLDDIERTVELLCKHFVTARLSNGVYGLYCKYTDYIEPLSCFIQMISFNYIACCLKSSNGALSLKILDKVWPIVVELYSPWMIPYGPSFWQRKSESPMFQQLNSQLTGGYTLQPWTNNDSENALIIINDFTDCLMFLTEVIPGDHTILSYLWNFYVESFAFASVNEHVLGVLHNCLISIPWSTYWPTFSDVEQMCKVVESYLPPCHSFLSVIFAQIPWPLWVKSLSVKAIGKGHAMILNLTVRLANDNVARDSPTWVSVMDDAVTKFNWNFLGPNNVEPVLNWLVMSIDARAVLGRESCQMDVALLNLLKIVCGYWSSSFDVQNVNLVELNTKRYYFVRSYVKLIVNASSKYKNLLESSPKLFEEAIEKMVVELAVCAKRENQPKDYFLSHLKELLNLMSNHTLQVTSRNAFLSWCNNQESHSAEFLKSVIQLSCSVKCAPYVVAPLVDTLIKLSFQYPGVTWASISEVTVVNPQDFNTYFHILSKDGYYLFLYSLLLRQSQTLLANGANTVCFLTDLIKNVKPKESNEDCLPLLYDLIIKAIVKILSESETMSDENTMQSVKKFLSTFSNELLMLSEGKQLWILGALGIGKTTELSLKGRLFVKSLALFLLVQIPTNCKIRLLPESSGHFTETSSAIKPHPDLQANLQKLEALKTVRGYAENIDLIDSVIKFISLPTNSLSSYSVLISLLTSNLYIAPYLLNDRKSSVLL